MGKTAIQAVRGPDSFRISADDPRLVIIGVDATDIYGERDSEAAVAHPLYDERAFLPKATRAHLVGLMREWGYIPSKPIEVWKDGDRLIVADGRRRLLAARELLAEMRAEDANAVFEVLVVGSKGNDASQFLRKVIGNAGRQELTPPEQARLAHEAMERFGFPREKVIVMFGFAGPQVLARRLKLLDLADPILARVGVDVALTVAEELADLPRPAQVTRLEQLVAEGKVTREAQHTALRDEKRARKNGNTTPTTRYPKWSHATMRKVAEKMEAGEIVVPGLASLSFADMVRLVTGELDPKTVKGVTKALRAVGPKSKQGDAGDAE